MVESGSLIYIAPSKCGSRDQEVQQDAKSKQKQLVTLGFPPVLARSGSDIDPMCAAIFINIVALLCFFKIVILKSYL